MKVQRKDEKVKMQFLFFTLSAFIEWETDNAQRRKIYFKLADTLALPQTLGAVLTAMCLLPHNDLARRDDR